MSGNPPHAPTGGVSIGLPDSQDYPRLVFTAPYFEQSPLAELIEPAVIEATQNALPSLVPPYVDAAAQQAVQQLAVLLTGSTMSGPLFLSPLMPTQPSQAATMAYVDAMIATAGIPEVPPVPTGQVWARETGQWVPITPQTGVFLPLAGGTMTGNIAMSGNTINGLAAVPTLPNGAAPAQWVLNQIASVSLYQGTWDADTNVPDLTQLSTHVNGYTWIAITTSVSGVVIGQPIPGLQGLTVYNGDTIIYSTAQGTFSAIHAGGLTQPEADARYVQLAGSQMSGPLLLNANASAPLQAVTLQQMQAFVPPGTVPEAPNDGQLYGRNGLTASWAPVLPLAGGILTGALTLAGNATANLNPVPLQQMTSAITAATAGYLPLAGGTMTGLFNLSGNATGNLNPVPLQQLNSMLNSAVAGYLPLTGGTLSGPGNLVVNASGAVSLPAAAVMPALWEAAGAGGLSLLIDGWNTAGSPNPPSPVVALRCAGGTPAAPVALQVNQTLGGYGWAGYASNGYQSVAPASLGTWISASAAENWTASAQGTNLQFWVTPAGSLPSATFNIVSVGTNDGFQVNSNNMRLLSSGTLNANLNLATSYSSWTMYNDYNSSALIWITSITSGYLMTLASGGNLTIAGSLTQGSDQTNKTNIAALSQGVSLVNQLIPKSYAWNSEPSVTKWGFIAQDVESVIPAAVSQGAAQSDGTPGLLGLDINAILAATVMALKQALARIVALEANANITPSAADLA